MNPMLFLAAPLLLCVSLMQPVKRPVQFSLPASFTFLLCVCMPWTSATANLMARLPVTPGDVL